MHEFPYVARLRFLLVFAALSDPRIALLGAMQSMFEASMYTFVFLWTPALSPNGEKIPHGLVFSCFMTACMVGGGGASGMSAHIRELQYYGVAPRHD